MTAGGGSGAAPRLTFLTVTHNSRDVVGPAIESVAHCCHDTPFEHIVVDNASRDGVVEYLAAAFPWVRVVALESNRGFGAGNNAGLAIARAEIVCLLNPDIRLRTLPGIDELSVALDVPDCGMIAGLLYYPDDRIQESLRRFPSLWTTLYRGFGLGNLYPNWEPYRRYLMADADYARPQTVDWAIGALLFAKRERLWGEFAGFDEAYFMYYEDTDLAWRMRQAGYRVYYDPRFAATHLYKRESARRLFSRLKLIHTVSMLRFLGRKALGRRPAS